MDYFGAMGTAILTKLAAGTTLVTALGGTAIYANQAPDEVDYPFVVFSHRSGGPDNSTPRNMRSNTWFVRAYARSIAQANYLDGLASAILNEGSLAVTGWTVFWLVREMDFSLEENLPNSQKIYMAGGDYRIRMSE